MNGKQKRSRPERKFPLRAKRGRLLGAALALLLVSWLIISYASLPPQAVISQEVLLSQPLTVRWQYASESTINLTPATDGTRIYLPLAAGVIVSLRPADGQMLWKSEIGGEISASPAADERGVYIASEAAGVNSQEIRARGALRALSRESGVTLWMRTLQMPLRGALVTNQSNLFGASLDGRVYALNKATGDLLWVAQHPSPFNSVPLIDGSRLYLGNDDGSLLALDQATGKTIWRYRTRGAVRGRPAAADGSVFFGSADGYVYAVNETDGRLRWRTRTGAGVQAVASAGGGLLVASLDNFVYFLSLARGDRLWKRQLAGRLAAQPLAATDGALFTPLSSDRAVVLDLQDGKQLNTLSIGEDSSTAASPITAGELLFLTTRHGLLAFSRPG